MQLPLVVRGATKDDLVASLSHDGSSRPFRLKIESITRQGHVVSGPRIESSLAGRRCVMNTSHGMRWVTFSSSECRARGRSSAISK